MIRGDFNASVGRDSERRGVFGNQELGRSKEAGRYLIEWCEEYRLVWVNEYMRHERSGTWRNLASGWVWGKRKLKASHGEENVNERCVCVVRASTSVHERE